MGCALYLNNVCAYSEAYTAYLCQFTFGSCPVLWAVLCPDTEDFLVVKNMASRVYHVTLNWTQFAPVHLWVATQCTVIWQTVKASNL